MSSEDRRGSTSPELDQRAPTPPPAATADAPVREESFGAEAVIEVDSPIIQVYDPYSGWSAIENLVKERMRQIQREAATAEGYLGRAKCTNVDFESYQSLSARPSRSEEDEESRVYLYLMVIAVERAKDVKTAMADYQAWKDSVVMRRGLSGAAAAGDADKLSPNPFYVILVHPLLLNEPITSSPAGDRKRSTFFKSKTAEEKLAEELEQARKKMESFRSELEQETAGRVSNCELRDTPGILKDVLVAAYMEKDQHLMYKRMTLERRQLSDDWDVRAYWALSRKIAVNYLRFGGLVEASSVYGKMFGTWTRSNTDPNTFTTQKALLSLCESKNMFHKLHDPNASRWEQPVTSAMTELECIVLIAGCEMLVSQWTDNAEASLERFTVFIQECSDRLLLTTLPRDLIYWFLMRACQSAFAFCEESQQAMETAMMRRESELFDGWNLVAAAAARGKTTTSPAHSRTASAQNAGLTLAAPSFQDTKPTQQDASLAGYTISLGDLCVQTKEYFVKLAREYGMILHAPSQKDAEESSEPAARLPVNELNSRDAFLAHYLRLTEAAAERYRDAGRRRSENVQLCDYATVLLQTNRRAAAALVETSILHHFERSDWGTLSLNARVLYINCLETDAKGSVERENHTKYIQSCLKVMNTAPKQSMRDTYWSKALVAARQEPTTELVEMPVDKLLHGLQFHVEGPDGAKVYLPNVCKSHLEERVVFIITARSPVDIGEHLSLELVLESKKNWQNPDEDLWHEVTLTKSETTFANGAVTIAVPFPPCHAGDYRIRSLQLHFFRMSFSQSFSTFAAPHATPGASLLSNGSESRSVLFPASPAGVAATTGNEGIVLHVFEPDSGVTLSVKPWKTTHCFGDSPDFLDLKIDIEKPLFLPSEAQKSAPSNCRLVSSGKAGSGTNLQITSVQAERAGVASAADVAHNLTLADRRDDTFIGRIVLGNLVRQSASISFQQFVPEPDRNGSIPASPSGLAPTPSGMAPNLAVPETTQLSDAKHGDTFVTVYYPNKLADLSNPVAFLEAESGGESKPIQLVMKGAMMPNGLIGFSLHLSDASSASKAALFHATTLHIKVPLLPRYVAEQPINLSFLSSRDNDMCIRTTQVPLQFRSAFDTKFEFRTFQDRVHCWVSLTSRLPETNLRIISAKLKILDDGPTYFVKRISAANKDVGCHPLQPRGTIALMFELSPDPNFITAQEIVRHSVRLVVRYRDASAASQSPQRVAAGKRRISHVAMQMKTFHERMTSVDYDAQLVESDGEDNAGNSATKGPSSNGSAKKKACTPSPGPRTKRSESRPGEEDDDDFDEGNVFFSPVAHFESKHSCPFSAIVLIEDEVSHQGVVTRTMAQRAFAPGVPIRFHATIEPNPHNWPASMPDSCDMFVRVLVNPAEWMPLGLTVQRVCLTKTSECRLHFAAVPLLPAGATHVSLPTPSLQLSRMRADGTEDAASAVGLDTVLCRQAIPVELPKME